MDGAGVFELDGADTRAAQIAAEVAARYGCAVRADVVQVVPFGASGLPVLQWDAATNALRYVPQEGRVLTRFNPHSARKSGFAARADYQQVMARRNDVRSLHADGKTVRAMAQILEVSEGVIRHDHVHLGLTPHPPIRAAYTVPLAVAQRRLQITALAAQGKAAGEIGAVLGYNAKAIKVMARAAGITLPATVRRENGGRSLSPATIARRAEVMPKAAAGWTVAAMAAWFGVTTSTIYDDLKTVPELREKVVAKLNPQRGHQGGGPAPRPEMAQVPGLVAAGKTRAEMAEALGVHINLVARWVRELGLTDAVKPALDMAPILARRAAVQRFFEAGDDALQMAKKLSVTAAVIKEDLKLLGLSLRERDAAIAADRDLIIQEMRHAGLTQREISDRAGVAPSTVQRILAAEREAA